jgi:hypothetical protein
MISEQDLSQVKNYVIQILPQLLSQEPEILTTIEGILAQQFPRREEFAQLLNEVRLLREDMQHRFEQVDKRFEQVDKRFEQIDKRLEQIDKRFEQIDRRIDLLQEEMNKRFEQVDKRFEQVDRRIDLLHEEMNKRFEQVDKRFDEIHKTQLSIKRDIAKLTESQNMVLKRMEGQDKWLKFVTGNMGDEKGKTLEQMFAEGLRYGLKNPDIKAESIQLRQILEKVLLGRLFSAEVDMIVENSKMTVFEIKAQAKPGDVSVFSLKVDLAKELNPKKQVQGTFISLGASEEVRERCIECGIELVD